MKALIVIANIVLVLLLAAAGIALFKPDPVQSTARGSSAAAKSKGNAKGAKGAKGTKGAKGAKGAKGSKNAKNAKNAKGSKGTKGGKDKTESSDRNATAGAAAATTAKNREEQKNIIVDSDIFNAERTPNAAFGRANTRVELMLVGTIETGNYRAAIIVQRTNTRQINPFMRMMWGGGPGGPGGPGGGRGGRRFGMGLNQNNQRRNNPAVVQQYVRLGQTMPNGYKLTALTRTRATLTRGGDKMELELQAPSKNQNAARRTTQRLNVNQQLQQAQIQTQQMMVRALMDMRNAGGARGGGGNRGGGNRGGRR